MGEISVGPALLLVFKSWRQSVNANIQAVPLKLFIMKSPSNAAQKKKIFALRAGSPSSTPPPHAGDLTRFLNPGFSSPTYFRFAHGLVKKMVFYIETNHVSGRSFPATFSHSVSGNHKSGLPGTLIDLDRWAQCFSDS